MSAKGKGRGRQERYVKLRHWLLNSQAWNSLSGNARALYVELAQRYNGSNNGRRRESALDQIKEHLDFRPLETFKAEHLEVLVMLIAYWRELETEPPFGAGAPKPDSLQ